MKKLIIILILFSCSPEQTSKISGILNAAVSKGQISLLQKEEIEKEYNEINSVNSMVAAKYIGMLTTHLNLGKDDELIRAARLKFISENSIDINLIAGHTRSEVERLLGKPDNIEIIKPSNAGCPCPKITYKDGDVEVVFINGVADWITVNSPEKRIVNIPQNNRYKSVQQSDFIYIKVSTK